MKQEIKVPTFKDGKILCDECGRGFNDLTLHVKTHGYSADEYRIRYGYRLTEPLCKPELREVKSNNGRHKHRIDLHLTPKAKRWVSEEHLLGLED